MLSIHNVSKHYGNIKALKNISIRIPKGVCYGLVGPNGAGKSTLIKMIATIIRDYKGSIQFNDKKLTSTLKYKLGYVPQDIILEENISAAGNVYLFGRLYGLKGNQLRQQAQEVLELIGLRDRSKDKVITFSGGMKRRLNIGCALMHNPDLIIMDEPTVGIDPQSRLYIFQMIEALKIDGKTVIYASHYMEEVENLCDYVAFLDRGHLIEDGGIRALLQQYAVTSIYVKASGISRDELKQHGTVSVYKDGFLLYTKQPLEAMENIISHCRKHRIDAERLELVRPRQEDVFFKLTGSNLRDEGGK